jgi:hypothetical protein
MIRSVVVTFVTFSDGWNHLITALWVRVIIITCDEREDISSTRRQETKGELMTGANHDTSVWLNMEFLLGVPVTEQTTGNDRDWVELVIHPRE